MKWSAEILAILEKEGIPETFRAPNGQTAAEFLEGAIMGAVDEIEDPNEVAE